jgi:hypothetical protein
VTEKGKELHSFDDLAKEFQAPLSAPTSPIVPDTLEVREPRSSSQVPASPILEQNVNAVTKEDSAESDLARALSEVDAVRTELTRLTESAHNQTAVVEGLHEEKAGLEKELFDLREQIEQERANRLAELERIENKAQELEAQESRITEDLGRLDIRENDLDAQAKDLDRRRNEQDARDRSLSARKASMTRKEYAIALREVECSAIEDKNRELKQRIRALRRERKLSDEVIESQQRELNRNETKIDRLLAEIQQFGNLAVTSDVIRDWLVQDDEDKPELGFPHDVVTVGSGPFKAGKFDSFIGLNGHSACEIGYDTDVMVVGRTGWTPAKLEKQLTAMEGGILKIYSQEMFIMALATGQDPFDADNEVLLAFGEGHPALEYLMECPFEWPKIGEPLPDEVPFESDGLVDESPLGSMEYHVGRTAGLSPTRRKALLTEAYKDEIPWVGPDDYMEWWGEPGTRQRLWRIVHHLAWLIRTRRSNPSMEYAVDDWYEDLNWLRQKFYSRYMRFSWPDIHP